MDPPTSAYHVVVPQEDIGRSDFQEVVQGFVILPQSQEVVSQGQDDQLQYLLTLA